MEARCINMFVPKGNGGIMQPSPTTDIIGPESPDWRYCYTCAWMEETLVSSVSLSRSVLHTSIFGKRYTSAATRLSFP